MVRCGIAGSPHNLRFGTRSEIKVQRVSLSCVVHPGTARMILVKPHKCRRFSGALVDGSRPIGSPSGDVLNASSIGESATGKTSQVFGHLRRTVGAFARGGR